MKTYELLTEWLSGSKELLVAESVLAVDGILYGANDGEILASVVGTMVLALKSWAEGIIETSAALHPNRPVIAEVPFVTDLDDDIHYENIESMIATIRLSMYDPRFLQVNLSVDNSSDLMDALDAYWTSFDVVLLSSQETEINELRELLNAGDYHERRIYFDKDMKHHFDKTNEVGVERWRNGGHFAPGKLLRQKLRINEYGHIETTGGETEIMSRAKSLYSLIKSGGGYCGESGHQVTIVDDAVFIGCMAFEMKEIEMLAKELGWSGDDQE